jgi:dihydrofolate reductase
MTIISLIAAMDKQRGLGKNNKLLCHSPADLKYFKELTMGKPVIMGRKTYESIGRALPGRLNIVLSQKMMSAEVYVARSLSDALSYAQEAPELMIIGGADLFNQALPLADTIYLTIIDENFDADVFFPELDPLLWYCTDSTIRPRDEKNAYDMTFNKYKKILKSS